MSPAGLVEPGSSWHPGGSHPVHGELVICQRAYSMLSLKEKQNGNGKPRKTQPSYLLGGERDQYFTYPQPAKGLKITGKESGLVTHPYKRTASINGPGECGIS